METFQLMGKKQQLVNEILLQKNRQNEFFR